MAAVALTAPAGAKPHAGKVVRVVRRPRGLGGVPRLCLLQADALRQVSGNCMGPAPAVGDLVNVFLDQRVVAVVRLTAVAPATDTACLVPLAWIVSGTPVSGQPSFASGTGLIDVPLDARVARIVNEDHPPVARVGGVDPTVTAVDGNGDGIPDFELISYFCDDNGTPVAGTGPNSCMDSWQVSGRGFERVRQDMIKTCW
jgi:hypothetical protein